MFLTMNIIFVFVYFCSLQQIKTLFLFTFSEFWGLPRTAVKTENKIIDFLKTNIFGKTKLFWFFKAFKSQHTSVIFAVKFFLFWKTFLFNQFRILTQTKTLDKGGPHNRFFTLYLSSIFCVFVFVFVFRHFIAFTHIFQYNLRHYMWSILRLKQTYYDNTNWMITISKYTLWMAHSKTAKKFYCNNQKMKLNIIA